MSRPPPGPTYGYTTHSAVPPNYYYEDQEGYVGDYAESDGLSERSHLVTPHATEIYRKKQGVAAQVAAPHEHYRHNLYASPSYYYETVPTAIAQQVRRPAVPPTYRRHIPVVDERARYYTAAPLDEGFRDTVVYSSPHIAAVRRPTPPPPASPTIARPTVRRHPVTVRTPKYIRRPPAPNVYKKPSALCIPLSCQIDPAVNRRARRNTDEATYHPQTYTQQPQSKTLTRTLSVPMHSNASLERHPVTHTASFPRNVHMTQSDVDAVLARYETVFEGNALESGSEKYESTSSPSSINGKMSKTKLSANMKPKMPPSLKQKQERLVNKPERATSTKSDHSKAKISKAPHVDHLEVEEITTEVLDSMLTELMNSNCDNKINSQNQEPNNGSLATGKAEYYEKSNDSQGPSGKDSKESENKFTNNYNYQDIAQKMSQRAKTYQKCEGNSHIDSVASRKQEIPNSPRLNINNTPRTEILSGTPQQETPSTQYSKGDENGVTELHRSKSYIVNLIDRALSKELGTIPTNERYPATSKESEQLHARRAMGLMNKHLEKMDKGLCLEITQTLTDSLISNATAQPPEPETKQENTTCSCNIHDEPLYIKQLRQLRWGHLKHIQREVRRLEDLERFLDSCSSGMLK